MYPRPDWLRSAHPSRRDAHPPSEGFGRVLGGGVHTWPSSCGPLPSCACCPSPCLALLPAFTCPLLDSSRTPAGWLAQELETRRPRRLGLPYLRRYGRARVLVCWTRSPMVEGYYWLPADIRPWASPLVYRGQMLRAAREHFGVRGGLSVCRPCRGSMRGEMFATASCVELRKLRQFLAQGL